MREFIGDNVGSELDKSIQHVESNLKTQQELYNNDYKGDILSVGSKEKERVKAQIEGYKQELNYLNNLKDRYGKASDVSHENPSGIKPNEGEADTRR